MPVLLDFDGENLNVLVTASISTQLNVVLSIQNYVGRVRSLADQFRPKTPPAAAVASRNRVQGGWSQSGLDAGTSIAQYDESGILASRTCAVCTKIIRVKSSRRKHARLPSLLCSRNGCGQMYHLGCSRWARLSEDAIAAITADGGKSDARFYCDACVLRKALCYWDFLAAHTQHEQLLTENLFKSISISRVPTSPTALAPDPESMRLLSKSTGSEASQHETRLGQHVDSRTSKSGADLEDEDRSLWPSVMLFDQTSQLVGVGDKCFRVAASSRDPEMYVVAIRYVVVRAYPATRQDRAVPKKGGGAANSSVADPKWQVSYARQGALDTSLLPGRAIFWPASSTRDILALEYTRRSLDELETAFLYEFQGEQPHDKAYSVGSAAAATDDNCLWMNLTPRRGMCMKQLAAQLGHLKKLQEVHVLHTKKSDKPKTAKAGHKLRKPHFPGQPLSKIAVDATS